MTSEAPGERRKAWHTLKDVLRLLARDALAANGDASKFKLAFAIAGGGASGTYEAGVVKAWFQGIEEIEDAEIRELLHPQIVVGTSAGALNAAAILFETVHAAAEAPAPRGAWKLAEKLWLTVDHGLAGSRFVVGKRRRFIVQGATRWVRRSWVAEARRPLILAGSMFLAVVIGATLFGFVSLGAVAQIVGGLLGILLIVLVAVVRAFWDSVFPNRALRRTLSNAVVLKDPSKDLPEGPGSRASELERLQEWLERRVAPTDEERAGRSVVERWKDLAERGQPVPDFIFTATNLGTQDTTLFALAREAAVVKLAKADWHVHRFQARGEKSDALRQLPGAISGTRDSVVEAPVEVGWIDPGELISCIVASTSIPAAFPSQRIPVHYFGVKDAVQFDFVDGGVLRNEPVHVALDAGATHVISLELDPPEVLATIEQRVKTGVAPPNLVTNTAMTFGTLLRASTGRDIEQAASWNKALYKQSVAGSAGPSGKRLIEIFRVAPKLRRVGALDFDGVYPDGREPEPTLTAWMEQGFGDAAEEPIFWHATLQGAPTPNNQKECLTCEMLERLRRSRGSRWRKFG